jgi:hypothetical protein
MTPHLCGPECLMPLCADSRITFLLWLLSIATLCSLMPLSVILLFLSPLSCHADQNGGIRSPVIQPQSPSPCLVQDWATHHGQGLVTEVLSTWIPPTPFSERQGILWERALELDKTRSGSSSVSFSTWNFGQVHSEPQFTYRAKLQV